MKKKDKKFIEKLREKKKKLLDEKKLIKKTDNGKAK